ncbi:MAG: flavodoxin family protein [Pseudomonadota bacterium]
MINIAAIYGSPRLNGNTALLLKQAVQGARGAGAHVEEIFLRNLKISPCLEIYGCKTTGRCVIQDDFQKVQDILLASDGIMLASPIFFYTVSAHTKIFMDRCQSLWVKKYWIDQVQFGKWEPKRKGLFISVGATSGKKLFEGPLLTVKFFLDVLDAELWRSLLYRGLDFEGDVLKHPEYLTEAFEAGQALSLELTQNTRTEKTADLPQQSKKEDDI